MKAIFLEGAVYLLQVISLSSFQNLRVKLANFCGWPSKLEIFHEHKHHKNKSIF